MNFLVIGNMGREHALIEIISKSQSCNKVYFAPSSDAIERQACFLADLDCDNYNNIVEICKTHKIKCVVIGPEQPLVDGLADKLRLAGIAVFGPSKLAAQIEGSKIFMKDLAKKYNIPTANYESFDDFDKAKKYLTSQKYPLVIKADGLAAGKGVVICQNYDQALKCLNSFMIGQVYGESSKKIVIEEFLSGDELSYFVLTDGKTNYNFATAKDYKKAYDNDEGLNTGGMGTFSPGLLGSTGKNITKDLDKKINKEIIDKLLFALKSEKIDYKGVLFFGLMIKDDEVKLLEINIRFGDPETQSMLVRFDFDLADLLYNCASSNLNEWILKNKDKHLFSDNFAVTIVYATKGYPEEYPKNTEIENLAEIENKYQNDKDLYIFHCATFFDQNKNKWFSKGGRVLNVTAKGKSLDQARNKAYKVIKEIKWQDGFYRNDICL